MRRRCSGAPGRGQLVTLVVVCSALLLRWASADTPPHEGPREGVRLSDAWLEKALLLAAGGSVEEAQSTTAALTRAAAGDIASPPPAGRRKRPPPPQAHSPPPPLLPPSPPPPSPTPPPAKAVPVPAPAGTAGKKKRPPPTFPLSPPPPSPPPSPPPQKGSRKRPPPPGVPPSPPGTPSPPRKPKRLRPPPPELPLAPSPPPPPPPRPPPPPLQQEPDIDWARYPSYAQLSEYLALRVAGSLGRCSLASAGKSVQGRDLWAVTIGDPSGVYYPDPANPDVPFPKARAAYIGVMHGDEKGHISAVLRLIGELCDPLSEPKFAPGGVQDANVTDLLASTVLYVLPLMNPDGYTATQRYNANGVDLNRNFLTSAFPFATPTPADGYALQPGTSSALYNAAADWTDNGGGGSHEPETLAVMSWLAAVRPHVSADLHGGAMVASYALDACDSRGEDLDCPSPEAPLPGYLANVYSMNHPSMRFSWGEMQASRQVAFFNGTTQGATWYPAIGTIADWLHHTYRRHMLTLELHYYKYAMFTADKLNMYATNRASMLRLAGVGGHMGLRALLRDATSGAPLAATVTPQQPGGAWAPEVENGGLVWKMAMPGVTYSGTIMPYDPADTSVSYEPIPYSFVVPYSWDDVLAKVPRANLAIARVFRAVRVGGPAAQASTATASPPQLQQQQQQQQQQSPPPNAPQPPAQQQQQQQ
ncbi:hypothetical protein HXX76_013049 [Chlamydomonas incerta]|uniref:Peptidase M14 domain-containing protein n=1 Tax=Chlamydomonas incerta TaxID=51695 RepID=A0A835SFJ2_CHLIN|nr:hypothetical protein HXX76_013049 [Chlamydomonas incerta]|eukprot:KAG2426292.1 hypothetical protein HXX76_013049 [Chlamydomonas incerta]